MGYIGDITSLVQNYVALGCICEFDDEFINMYRSLRLQIFFNFEFEVKNYRQDKVLLSIEKFDEKTIPMDIPEEGLIMAEIMNE